MCQKNKKTNKMIKVICNVLLGSGGYSVERGKTLYFTNCSSWTQANKKWKEKIFPWVLFQGSTYFKTLFERLLWFLYEVSFYIAHCLMVTQMLTSCNLCFSWDTAKEKKSQIFSFWQFLIFCHNWMDEWSTDPPRPHQTEVFFLPYRLWTN